MPLSQVLILYALWASLAARQDAFISRLTSIHPVRPGSSRTRSSPVHIPCRRERPSLRTLTKNRPLHACRFHFTSSPSLRRSTKKPSTSRRFHLMLYFGRFRPIWIVSIAVLAGVYSPQTFYDAHGNHLTQSLHDESHLRILHSHK